MTNKVFVLATANLGKIHEMNRILTGLGIRVVSRKDIGIDIAVDETGTTYEENALLKAKAICGVSGLPSIADDSGLEVSSLGGKPGVFSSTFGGAHLDDEERCAYLLKEMENMEQRDARFVCSIVCVNPNGGIISVQGECGGEIAYSPRGKNGFGYDPIFLPHGTGKTMAELPPEEKNALSHRGAALRAFRARMNNEQMW